MAPAELAAAGLAAFVLHGNDEFCELLARPGPSSLTAAAVVKRVVPAKGWQLSDFFLLRWRPAVFPCLARRDAFQMLFALG